jgi:hypothetical protein
VRKRLGERREESKEEREMKVNTCFYSGRQAMNDRGKNLPLRTYAA